MKFGVTIDLKLVKGAMEINNRNFLYYAGLFSYIGFAIAIPIIGGTLLGYYIDERFGRGHIFIFVFLILGLIDGFYNMIRIALRSSGIRKKR